MNLRTLVIYHANCPDGFGAAFAAWLHFGVEADYSACNYGQPPPDVTVYDRIYVLDFSFPRSLLEGMAYRSSVQVIDHHKTAAEDLAGLPALVGEKQLAAIFDMEHSGAVLAYEFFHPGRPVPMFFSYIEDRDLWSWKLPYSKEVSAWLGSHPMDFVLWTQLEQMLEPEHFESVVLTEGRAILRAKQQAVSQMANQATTRTIQGHEVPTVNATIYFSEVGEELCLRNPAAPFAAYYFDRSDGVRQWGLRSRGGFDCSAVAKAMGGGGHPGASRFEEKLK